MSALFAVVNIRFFQAPETATLDAAAAAMSLCALVYFRRTGDTDSTARALILILFFVLGGSFLMKGNEHFVLYWAAVVPPVSFYLLGRRGGLWASGLFGVFLLGLLWWGLRVWGPAPFTVESVSNIIAAQVGLMVLAWQYERVRQRSVGALRDRNRELRENRRELRLILDTTAEAICGFDREGICTFCNHRFLELLGHASEADVLGLAAQELLVSPQGQDAGYAGTGCPVCEVAAGTAEQKTFSERFRRAGGSSFLAECHVSVRREEGEPAGAVLSFSDITERKANEERIHYLGSHDTLTGLWNRGRLGEEMQKLDVPENWPLSVLFADANGLKLINDVFGHAAGDELLQQAAKTLREVFGEDLRGARVSGDEFAVLLPRTGKELARELAQRVEERFSQVQVRAVRGSIAVGTATKDGPLPGIGELFRVAEQDMYAAKMKRQDSFSGEMIEAIVERLFRVFPDARRHSVTVAETSAELGRLKGFEEADVRVLREAGFLHDIGKVAMDEGSLPPAGPLDGARIQRDQHPVMGLRILRAFDETLGIGQIVYSHHEHWDGSGFPRGIAGEEIPRMARMVAVAAGFDRLVNVPGGPGLSAEEAIRELESQAGTRWAPEEVQSLIFLVRSPRWPLLRERILGRLDAAR